MTPSAPNVEALADAIRDARPPLDVDGSRVVHALYALLSAGSPVTEASLVGATGLPEELVRERLEAWPGVVRDDAGQIVGFGGLTVLELPPHTLTIHGVRLSAWCAWDTLFMPSIVQATAEVESRDALTGETVALTVTADGVSNVSHLDLALSFLLPNGSFDDDVVGRFCQFIHFFADAGNAERWTADHPGTFVLTLDDAVELATRHVATLTAGPTDD